MIILLSDQLLLLQHFYHLITHPIPQHFLLLFAVLLAPYLLLDSRRADLGQIHFHYLAVLRQFLMQEVVALAIEHNKRIFLQQLLPVAPEMHRVQDVPSEHEVKLCILVLGLQLSQQVVGVDWFLERLAEVDLLFGDVDLGVRFEEVPHQLESCLFGEQEFLVVSVSARHQPYFIDALHACQVLDQFYVADVRRIEGSSVNRNLTYHHAILLFFYQHDSTPCFSCSFQGLSADVFLLTWRRIKAWCGEIIIVCKRQRRAINTTSWRR